MGLVTIVFNNRIEFFKKTLLIQQSTDFKATKVKNEENIIIAQLKLYKVLVEELIEENYSPGPSRLNFNTHPHPNDFSNL